jgi:hypothetical protein
MNEHPSDNLWERYRQAQLTPGELLALDAHLATCADCRNCLLAAELGAYPRRAASAMSVHLDYEQLAAFVKGELAAAAHQQAESHVRQCAACAFQADELRAFAATVNPRKRYGPPVSAWRSWLDFLRAPTLARPLLAGATFAALLIIAFVSWRALQNRPPAQVAVTTASPELTPDPIFRPPQSTPTPSPAVEPATELALLRVSYSDVTLRGAADAVLFKIPAQATQGRITLTNVKDDAPSYSALLVSNAGEQIRLASRLRRSGRNVNIPVPVARLKNNQTYKLMLSNGTETVASFSFKVSKG